MNKIKNVAHLQRPITAVKSLRRKLNVSLVWAPWDFRVGISYIPMMKTIYIVPVPCIGIVVQLPRWERLALSRSSGAWIPKDVGEMFAAFD